jgi:hypothetical protein
VNRIERRVRDLINPYSTAFAGWWCHSGRYTRVARLIPGIKAATSPRPLSRPARPRRNGAGLDFAPPAPEIMARRRAALDTMLAADPRGGPDDLSMH